MFKLPSNYSSQMVEKTLRKLGLSGNEVKVYLSLLPLKKAPASTVGYRTKLERTTARYVCQQLAKRGIVLEQREGNTFYYCAEPPEKLLFLLEEARDELHEREVQIQRIMGQLKGMADPESTLPKVQFYQGIRGVSQAYQKVLEELEPGDEICSFSNILEPSEDPFDAHPFLSDTEKFRAEKGISLRIIAPKTKASREFKKSDKEFLRKTKLSEMEHQMIHSGDICILKDKIFVIALAPNGEFCTEIKNEDFCRMYQALFEMAWNTAK